MFCFMSAATGEEHLLRCKSSTAANMKGELDAPNGTTAKRYVRSLSVDLSVLDSHKNLVKILSSGCKWTWRNAFSMSVETVKAWLRKCNSTPHEWRYRHQTIIEAGRISISSIATVIHNHYWCCNSLSSLDNEVGSVCSQKCVIIISNFFN